MTNSTHMHTSVCKNCKQEVDPNWYCCPYCGFHTFISLIEATKILLETAQKAAEYFSQHNPEHLLREKLDNAVADMKALNKND